MNKIIFLIISCYFCLGTFLNANEDLLDMLELAVEAKNVKLVNEVVEALLRIENNSANMLDALTRYNNNGRAEFALHNAIKDKNIIASLILTPYTRDINSRYANDAAWISVKSGTFREGRTPLELALEADMIEIIPHLMIKGANPNLMRKIYFFYEGEENFEYLTEFGFQFIKKICSKSKKEFTYFPHEFSRTFIGEVISKDRIDVIEIIQQTNRINWNVICCKANFVDYTPLQFALKLKRYEIAQFLLDHGATIE